METEKRTTRDYGKKLYETKTVKYASEKDAEWCAKHFETNWDVPWKVNRMYQPTGETCWIVEYFRDLT